MHHHTENESSLSSLFSLLSALVLSSSLSSPLLPLSLSSFTVSLCLCLSLSVSVWCCVLCCGVVCVVWHRENPVCPFKTPPCVRSKRLRVCRHHAYMCFNMCVGMLFSTKNNLTFDTRTRTGTERTDEVSMGNYDTVKELGSLVQQAQLRAGVKSNRGSGNCAESRTHSFTSAVEKFLRHRPSTILHSEGTLSNHGQQPRTGICAQV